MVVVVSFVEAMQLQIIDLIYAIYTHILFVEPGSCGL